MKIGFILDTTFDSTDGVQQYVRTVGAWLSERGHDVYYLVGESEQKSVPNIYSLGRTVRVKYNGNWLSIPLPAATRKLRQLTKQLQLDVLHVQTPYSPFLAGKLVRLATNVQAVVGTFHVLPYGFSAKLGNRILGKINAKTAKRFDAMMAASEPAQQFAKTCYGFNSTVIPHPCQIGKLAASDSETLDAATESKCRIVFLGRLVERKGACHLLAAVAYLQENRLSDIPFEVSIAGKGPEMAALQRYVKSHGLEKLVSFTGFISETEKPELLQAADILAFPSTAGESFGISVLEGMAASKGVVLAGNNPGYASVVADSRQLIDPTDTLGFATALVYWLSHKAERAAIAKKQRAHASSFDISQIGPRIEQIYNQALQNRHKA